MSTTRTIAVYADSIRFGRCRSSDCGASIFFAQTVATGKHMPFTGEPVPLRTTIDDASGRQVYHLDFEHSHFRDCVSANRFSASRRAR